MFLAPPTQRLAAHLDSLRIKHPEIFTYTFNKSPSDKTTHNFFKQFKTFYRGFSRPDYSDVDLISYFCGDRTKELRSWAYSKILDKKIRTGIPIKQAIESTDQQIAEQVLNDLQNTTPGRYAADHVTNTVSSKSLADKNSTMISFDVDMSNLAVMYAKVYLEKSIKSPTKNTKPPVAIVLEVQEQQPRGLPITYSFPMEYNIISHVPVNDVSGAFIGYPAKENQLLWFYLKINDRESNGAASSISISSVIEHQGRLEGRSLLAEVKKNQTNIISPETISQSPRLQYLLTTMHTLLSQ